MDGPGDGVGDGAEKRSRGRPELVMFEVEFDEAAAAEEEPAALSDGRERPP